MIAIRPISAARARPRRRQRGFTLTELMVSSVLLVIIIMGIISGHIFGLRMLRLIELATVTNESDRRLLRQLNDDLVAAKYWEVGSASQASFTRLGLNRLQQANGLQLYYADTAGSNQFARYYLSASRDTLYRLSSATPTPAILATNIINNNIFTMENWAGNTLSNRIQNPTLGLALRIRDTPRRAWGVGRDNETHWLRVRLATRATD